MTKVTVELREIVSPEKGIKKVATFLMEHYTLDLAKIHAEFIVAEQSALLGLPFYVSCIKADNGDFELSPYPTYWAPITNLEVVEI